VSRGRPRQFSPTAPAHIDQRQLPPDCYWQPRDRCWYARKGGYKRLGGPDATLAELHAAVELHHEGGNEDVVYGSVAWLHGRFQKSDKWKSLSGATQRDYDACLRALARVKTKIGTADRLLVNRLDKVVVQLLVDAIGRETPSMANHVKRWLQRLFKWGMARGHMKDRPNPAAGLEAPQERAEVKMPTPRALAAVTALARDRGAQTAHTRGSVAHYLWPFIVLAYRCRMRSIEVLTLTEADNVGTGILARRRKGSKHNITGWPELDPTWPKGEKSDLREAWDAALARRDLIWERTRTPTPLRAEDRRVLVTEEGRPIEYDSVATAWRRLMTIAIKEGIIDREERFTPHGLKHRGITDSENKADGGHVDPRMIARYDHEVPVVAPAGKRPGKS
jgi:hypothetical protein